MLGIEKNRINLIYEHLEDDISKRIFEDRLLYSFVNDTKFIRDMVFSIPIGKSIFDRLYRTKRKIVIFGTGSVGRGLERVYKDIHIFAFCDNNRDKSIRVDVPTIGFEDLCKHYKNADIVISSVLYHKEILSQLHNNGFSANQIINLGFEYEKLNYAQYFDLPQLKHESEEVFVDAGGYDGKTSLGFKRWCEGRGVERYRSYVWEPGIKESEMCIRTLNKADMDYTFFKKGVWDKDTILRFSENAKSSSFSENGNITVDAGMIDTHINDTVSFIKMDVEGAEFQALIGAEKTIKKYRPKLAICIYHKPEDIIEIPQLILDMNSNYKLYLRHYSFTDVETVLYAI